jgi:hypothetical protein
VYGIIRNDCTWYWSSPVNAHRDCHTPREIDGKKRTAFTFTQNSLSHWGIPIHLNITLSYQWVIVNKSIPVSSIYIWREILSPKSEASFVLTVQTKTIERDWNWRRIALSISAILARRVPKFCSSLRFKD